MTTEEMRIRMFRIQRLFENGMITLGERNALLAQLSDLFLKEWQKVLDK